MALVRVFQHFLCSFDHVIDQFFKLQANTVAQVCGGIVFVCFGYCEGVFLYGLHLPYDFGLKLLVLFVNRLFDNGCELFTGYVLPAVACFVWPVLCLQALC
jgi:hypothetical protein